MLKINLVKNLKNLIFNIQIMQYLLIRIASQLKMYLNKFKIFKKKTFSTTFLNL